MYRFVSWLCQPYSVVLVAMAVGIVWAWAKRAASARHLLWMGSCWSLLVVFSANALRPHPELNDSSLYRCLRAAELYRESGGCTVLISGGKPNPDKPGDTCSHVMRDFLRQLGVNAADVQAEDQSRTTYES